MSVEFIFRLLGMIGFAIGGLFWGQNLGIASNVNPRRRHHVCGAVHIYFWHGGCAGRLDPHPVFHHASYPCLAQDPGTFLRPNPGCRAGGSHCRIDRCRSCSLSRFLSCRLRLAASCPLLRCCFSVTWAYRFLSCASTISFLHFRVFKKVRTSKSKEQVPVGRITVRSCWIPV